MNLKVRGKLGRGVTSESEFLLIVKNHYLFSAVFEDKIS